MLIVCVECSIVCIQIQTKLLCARGQPSARYFDHSCRASCGCKLSTLVLGHSHVLECIERPASRTKGPSFRIYSGDFGLLASRAHPAGHHAAASWPIVHQSDEEQSRPIVERSGQAVVAAVDDGHNQHVLCIA